MNNKNDNPVNLYKWTVSTNVNWQTHDLIQQYATKTGRGMTVLVRELLEDGLDARSVRNDENIDATKMRLFKLYKQVQEKQNIRDTLKALKWNVSEEEFRRQCQTFGVNPDDYDDVLQPIKLTKRDKCWTFLKILFFDRPEGLPVSRILEIAEEEGFGENMVREVMRGMGMKSNPQKINGNREWVWKMMSE